MPYRFRRPLIAVGLIATTLACLSGSVVYAADKARVDDAVKRGQGYLLKQSKSGPTGSLACYALLKSGIDKQHPDVQKVVQEIVSKCRTEGYSPGQHHTYEGGVDSMLLEAVDPVAYRPQIQAVASYLIGKQRACGGWNYPDVTFDGGDTSITQYALLGLWAAVRTGIDVPVEVWERAAKWHIEKQSEDGQFSYHPYVIVGKPEPHDPRPASTMTVAGTGSLLIARRMLYTDVRFHESVRPANANRRFGVLEALPDDIPVAKGAAPGRERASQVSIAVIDRAIKNGAQAVGSHFLEKEKSARIETWHSYYLYGIERVTALLDVDKIGGHDWYEEGADELLRRQQADGSWQDNGGPVAATSLSILFLTKATAKSLPPSPKKPVLVGGGLLVGGRGLPENLDAVQVKDGLVGARKMRGAVDGLLAELEKSSDAKVEAVQAAVVEAVQLDRPEELIAQVDRLKKLATDSRVEVRRTAMWALGRTGNISVAPLLIQGLTDPDAAVSREASVGLSILSRRPEGCGMPVDPTEGLNEDATDDERKTHLDKWRKDSANLWQKWYLRVRPYNERDDRTLLKRKS